MKELAPSVLSHRIIVKPNAELRGLTATAVLAEVLDSESVPLADRRFA
ncbi:MAG: hypothetical protein ACREQ5_20575 [Candidatus Dormibacteria bacterium]